MGLAFDLGRVGFDGAGADVPRRSKSTHARQMYSFVARGIQSAASGLGGPGGASREASQKRSTTPPPPPPDRRSAVNGRVTGIGGGHLPGPESGRGTAHGHEYFIERSGPSRSFHRPCPCSPRSPRSPCSGGGSPGARDAWNVIGHRAVPLRRRTRPAGSRPAGSRLFKVRAGDRAADVASEFRARIPRERPPSRRRGSAARGALLRVVPRAPTCVFSRRRMNGATRSHSSSTGKRVECGPADRCARAKREKRAVKVLGVARAADGRLASIGVHYRRRGSTTSAQDSFTSPGTHPGITHCSPGRLPIDLRASPRNRQPGELSGTTQHGQIGVKPRSGRDRRWSLDNLRARSGALIKRG